MDDVMWSSSANTLAKIFFNLNMMRKLVGPLVAITAARLCWIISALHIWTRQSYFDKLLQLQLTEKLGKMKLSRPRLHFSPAEVWTVCLCLCLNLHVFSCSLLSQDDASTKSHIHTIYVQQLVWHVKNRFNTAALLLLAALAQACVMWPIRADWLIGRRGDLNETGAKTECRGGIQCCSTGQYQKPNVIFF